MHECCGVPQKAHFFGSVIVLACCRDHAVLIRRLDRAERKS